MSRCLDSECLSGQDGHCGTCQKQRNEVWRTKKCGWHPDSVTHCQLLSPYQIWRQSAMSTHCRRGCSRLAVIMQHLETYDTNNECEFRTVQESSSSWGFRYTAKLRDPLFYVNQFLFMGCVASALPLGCLCDKHCRKQPMGRMYDQTMCAWWWWWNWFWQNFQLYW